MFKHHSHTLPVSVPHAMTSRVLMFWLQGHTEQTPPKTYTCKKKVPNHITELVFHISYTSKARCVSHCSLHKPIQACIKHTCSRELQNYVANILLSFLCVLKRNKCKQLYRGLDRLQEVEAPGKSRQWTHGCSKIVASTRRPGTHFRQKLSRRQDHGAAGKV